MCCEVRVIFTMHYKRTAQVITVSTLAAQNGSVPPDSSILGMCITLFRSISERGHSEAKWEMMGIEVMVVE